MTDTILEVRNISKTFEAKRQSKEVLKSISFEIKEGEIVALLGPNGAGKTTTVQIIASYLDASGGQVLMNNEQLTPKSRRHIKMGVVLGGELGFYGNATAKDNLKLFAHLDKIPMKQINQEIDRVLELVRLDDVKDTKVYTFSRGMRQRLHIARALMGKPQILLLDEPTTGLDVEIGKEIRDLIKRLTQTEKMAVLLTSHLMSEVEYLADTILLLGHGEIYHTGDTQSVIDLAAHSTNKQHATLEESYLALLAELKAGDSNE